jgi:hypothetical protein
VNEREGKKKHTKEQQWKIFNYDDDDEKGTYVMMTTKMVKGSIKRERERERNYL